MLPQLPWPKLDVLSIAIVAFSFDFVMMLFLSPAFDLSSRMLGAAVPAWLVGEVVGIVLVLVPAMLLFRWTENDTNLPLRAGGQVMLAALVFLYLIPELVFGLGPRSARWGPLNESSRLARELWAQVLLLLAVPGISAVQEFAARGGGTPLPYDPPRRLVTSGIYRYCANPMQLSCAVVMLAEALILRNLWLAAGAVMSAIYSAGLAHWDEDVDLERRFGAGSPRGESIRSSGAVGQEVSWSRYRAAVPAWRVRWQPFTGEPAATLYVAASCKACRGVRAFLEQRAPAGLVFCDAESLPSGSIRRLRYVPAGGQAESGVRAFARALEHVNFGWAFCGMLLRLPLIHHTAQLLADTAGFGPRTLGPVCATGQRAEGCGGVDQGVGGGRG